MEFNSGFKRLNRTALNTGYVHTVAHVYTESRLAQNSTCARHSGTELIVLRRRVSVQHNQLWSAMHSSVASTRTHQHYEITEWLRAGRSGDRILVEARFSAPIQAGTGAHPASCTMGTGSFPGVKSGRGVTLTPHPLLVSWWWKSWAIPLLPLWAVRPVQSLSACTRVHFTFYLT